MLNLLVIQQLDILYLGENHVRVVSERVKNSSVCVIKSILAIETLTTDDSPKYHTCKACRKLKGHDSWSTIKQKGQSGQLVISRLKLATCLSHE